MLQGPTNVEKMQTVFANINVQDNEQPDVVRKNSSC